MNNLTLRELLKKRDKILEKLESVYFDLNVRDCDDIELAYEKRELVNKLSKTNLKIKKKCEEEIEGIKKSQQRGE